MVERRMPFQLRPVVQRLNSTLASYILPVPLSISALSLCAWNKVVGAGGFGHFSLVFPNRGNEVGDFDETQLLAGLGHILG
jgi:hypothetical protein